MSHSAYSHLIFFIYIFRAKRNLLMANVFFLVAVSLLSGMPLHTNAFKYGKLPSYPPYVSPVYFSRKVWLSRGQQNLSILFSF